MRTFSFFIEMLWRCWALEEESLFLSYTMWCVVVFIATLVVLVVAIAVLVVHIIAAVIVILIIAALVVAVLIIVSLAVAVVVVLIIAVVVGVDSGPPPRDAIDYGQLVPSAVRSLCSPTYYKE